MPTRSAIHSAHNHTASRRAINFSNAAVRFAFAVAIIAGFFLSYWAAVTSEQDGLPRVSAAMSAESLSSTGASPEEVLTGISDLFSDAGSRVIVDFSAPDGHDIYVAGEGTDEWLREGYRGIPGSGSTRVQSLLELPHHEYRQVYEIQGPASLADELGAYFDELGIAHSSLEYRYIRFLLEAQLGDTYLLFLVACGVLCVSAVLVGSHADAVLWLHGYGVLRSAWMLCRKATLPWAPLAIGLIVVITLLEGAFFEVHSAWQWALLQVWIIGSGLAVCVLSLLAGILLLRRGSVLARLAGKLPAVPSLVGSYAIKVFACLAVATIAASLSGSNAELQNQRRDRDVWSHDSPLYAITLSGARGDGDVEATRPVLANKLRELSSEGRAVLANYTDAPAFRSIDLPADVMVFNDTGAEMSLRGALKNTYEADLDRSGIRMFAPQGAFDQDSAARLLSFLVSGESVAQDASLIEYAPGSPQSLTWETSDSGWLNRSVRPDPIVVVLPNDLADIADRNLVAAASSRDYLFPDYQDIIDLQRDPTVGSFIQSGLSMTEAWSQSHQSMKRLVWEYEGGLVAAIIVALSAAGTAVAVSLTIFHQRLRTSYMCGRLPLQAIAISGACEAIVCAAVCAYLWSKGAAYRTWTGDGPLAGSADPSLVASAYVPPSAWVLSLGIALLTAAPVMTILLWSRVSASVLKKAR